MEAAVVSDRWDDTGGGCERYLGELAEALRRAGHGARIFCHRKSAAPPGIPIYAAGPPRWRGELRLEKAVALYRAAYPHGPILATRAFRGVTHCQLHAGLLLHAFESERESLDSAARRFLYRPAARLNLFRRRLLATERDVFGGTEPPRVMAFSQSLADAIAATYGLPRDLVTVSYPGIDLSRFRPPRDADSAIGCSSSRLTFAFAGHNFVLKGLRWIIEAVAEGARAGFDCEVIVAGKGSVSAYRRMAARRGIEDRVRFLGPVDQGRLVEVYHGAAALLHPAFYDPFPRVIVEAPACGCPVVTTRRCGAAEIITPGLQGMVIDDPRDTPALLAAMYAFADGQRALGMRIEAARLGRRYSFAEHARQVLNWLGMGDARPA